MNSGPNNNSNNSSSSSSGGGGGGQGQGPLSQASFEEQIQEIQHGSDEMERLLNQATDVSTSPESTDMLLSEISTLKKDNKKKLAKLRNHVLRGGENPSSTDRPDEDSLGGKKELS
jgi:hypothetical protein